MPCLISNTSISAATARRGGQPLCWWSPEHNRQLGPGLIFLLPYLIIIVSSTDFGQNGGISQQIEVDLVGQYLTSLFYSFEDSGRCPGSVVHFRLHRHREAQDLGGNGTGHNGFYAFAFQLLTFGCYQNTTTSSVTSPTKSKKDAEPEPEITPLMKMLQNAGPLKNDGTDKFFGMENVRPLNLTNYRTPLG